MQQNNYDTLSEAIEDLKTKGYEADFSLQEHGLECVTLDDLMKPQEFEVDQMFRFEGMTNPSDSSVLYATSSDKHGLKGI